MTTTLRQIRHGVLPVESWKPPTDGDATFQYVDISSVDRATKAVTAVTPIPVTEAPSRARQVLRAHDVLVSTVRPNLNAVALVPEAYDGSIGSTGFTVLRANPVRLLPTYLFHWVRTPMFVADMVKKATGASYPAVSDRIILNSPMPMPGIAEQRRIADILDKADAIRRKRKDAIVLTEDLLRSAFLEMVGPCAREYESWPEAPFESLALPEKGSMRTGPFGSDLRHSEFVDDGVAVLGIDNAVTNRFAWGERRFITPQKYKKLVRYTVRPHDVIVTIMGTTGRSAVVPADIPLAITTKHLATISLNRDLAEPEFVAQAIHRHPAILAQIQQSNRGAIMSGLNLGLIKSLVVRLPPIDEQRRFAAFTEKLRAGVGTLGRGLADSESLFASLVDRAFSGRPFSEARAC